MRPAWVVLRKELTDAARDRRSWMLALAMAMLVGPLMFAVLSSVVSGFEERAANREVWVHQPQHAPTLITFLLRAGASVQTAPQDYEARLRAGTLSNAVLVPHADFESRLAAGRTATVDVRFDDSHDRARPQVEATLGLLQAFNRETGTQRLVARGIDPQLLNAVQPEAYNLAPAQARGAQLLFMVPWVALLMAVFGALPAAIDASAGERERGSLEPLLLNPVAVGELVLGKWGAVMAYATAIVVLTLAGFLVAMRFVSSETLGALLQLQWREVGVFLVVLLPFAALMAAVNLLAATFGRSHKEAQTFVSYVAFAVQAAAIVPIFASQRDALWQLLAPSVAQLSVLMKTLRGEPLTPTDLALPALVCLAGTIICLLLQARLLRREAIVFGLS